MNSLLTVPLLANTALAWAIGEGLPFNACECVLTYSIESDEVTAHVRLCPAEALVDGARHVADWARSYDTEAPSDGSVKILTFQVDPQGTLSAFSAALCSAVYCEATAHA